MKKIVLTLILAAFAFAANAQLVISANIGGSMTSGNVHTNTHVTVVTDSTASFDTPMEDITSYTAGVKVGYKFGKFQAGISGSYSATNITNQELDPSFIPMVSTSLPQYFVTTGQMSTKKSSFTVAPYFRYDVIQTGDVSLFVELSGFFTKVMNPLITAEIHNLGPAGFTFDTTFVDFPRPVTSTSFGVSVVPGLSWQLSKHCGIDLYMDFLALAYSATTTYRTDLKYTFSFSNMVLAYETDLTSYTTKENHLGAAITGTPLLTELGANNWVRVGFNFTF